MACTRRFDPQKKYSIDQIQQDFALMRSALEEAHPGLHRYTSTDSIRSAFEQTQKKLDHPMGEREFRRHIDPLFSMIRCGHTDIYPSNGYTKYIKKNKPKDFPIVAYFLQNHLKVLQNRTQDSTLTTGSEIIALDNRPVGQIIQQMQEIVPSDGYNQTFKNTVINGNFGSFYRYLYGSADTIRVTLKDTNGHLRTFALTLDDPPKNAKKVSSNVAMASQPNIAPNTTPTPRSKVPKSAQRRNLKFSAKDSSVAILDISTFRDRGYNRFYRKSFKTIQQKNTKHLVIDLRANGGGRSDASLRLMSYVLDSAYVVYDTVVAKQGRPTFNKHYDSKFIRWLARNFWVKKLPNGYWQNRAAGKIHQPSKKYGFKGPIYLLTNGGSFSAAAIFSSIVQQYNPRAVVIGRETGGGAHGCNAFISPYLTLPHTQTKVRIPMFKIVLRVPGRDQGHGVMPDYPVEYSFDDVQKNRDLDIEKVYALIKQRNQ